MKARTGLFIAVLLAPTFCIGLAHADIVVVVNAKSSLTTLSKDQVSDIFLGKSATLPSGEQAIPLELAEGSAIRDEFHGKITGKSPTQLKAYWSKMVFSGRATPPKEVPNPAEVRKIVATNPNTIGYLDKASVDANIKVVFQ